MKNLLKLSAVAMTVVAASAAPKFSASLNAGTAGVGAGLDFKIAKDLTIGANIDYFGLAFNKKKAYLKKEEINKMQELLLAELKKNNENTVFDSFNRSKLNDTESKSLEDKKSVKKESISSDIKIGINAKYHPFSNGFFVSAGVNMHKASVKTTFSADSSNLGDDLKKKIDIVKNFIGEHITTTYKATRFTPSVSLGYKANVSENVALGVEAGVEYIGTYKVKDGKETGSKFAALAQGGAFPLSKSLAKSGFLPSLKIGVSYAF